MGLLLLHRIILIIVKPLSKNIGIISTNCVFRSPGVKVLTNKPSSFGTVFIYDPLVANFLVKKGHVTVILVI